MYNIIHIVYERAREARVIQVFSFASTRNWETQLSYFIPDRIHQYYNNTTRYFFIIKIIFSNASREFRTHIIYYVWADVEFLWWSIYMYTRMALTETRVCILAAYLQGDRTRNDRCEKYIIYQWNLAGSDPLGYDVGAHKGIYTKRTNCRRPWRISEP